MVIPVGPPGAHVILKVVKQQNPDGSIRVARSNVYNKVVPFVAFTKLQGDVDQGHPRRPAIRLSAFHERFDGSRERPFAASSSRYF